MSKHNGSFSFIKTQKKSKHDFRQSMKYIIPHKKHLSQQDLRSDGKQFPEAMSRSVAPQAGEIAQGKLGDVSGSVDNSEETDVTTVSSKENGTTLRPRLCKNCGCELASDEKEWCDVCDLPEESPIK